MIFVWVRNQILGGTGGKVESKLENCHFPEESGAIVPVLPWKDRSPLLHILHPNYPSFYLKCPRKCQKPITLTFFQQFPKFACLALVNFGVDLKFIISSYVYIINVRLCKVWFFCFLQNLSKKDFWGVSSTPHLVQEGLI